jgi:delta24(24(1))-sterol reductase
MADMHASDSKPSHPGFVETPGRKKYTRRSIFTDRDLSETPEPSSTLDDADEKPLNGSALNGKPHANGHSNGSANGHANGNTNGYLNGSANGTAVKATTPESEQLKKLDNPAIDTSDKREFGGSLGMSAMMIGFPSLMYYMWIGAEFYDGKFPAPDGNESFKDFFLRMVYLVRTEAYPSNKAWQIYWFFGLLQMAFYMLLPGVYRKGKPLPHLNGQRLDYYCSAMWSFYTSTILGLLLHFTGLFKLYTLMDEFGPILSVAIISGFLCSFIAYTSAYARGATIRMTGRPIRDFFLGAELNPRLFGILDFKMFLEVRVPWFILWFLALGMVFKQYETYGYVSGEAIFLLFAQFLYSNACAKGEHLIITTW